MSTPALAGYVSKVDILSLRIQSLCNYKMYGMRQSQALNNSRQLSDFHKPTERTSSSAPSSVTHPSINGQAPGSQQSGGGHSEQNGDSGCGVTPSPTPSPASSTGSSHSLPPGLVAIPQRLEMLYKQQVSILEPLMHADTYWKEAEKRLQSADDKGKQFCFNFLFLVFIG